MRSGGHQAEATVISRPPSISAVWAIRARAVPVMPILAVVYVILIAVAELLTVMTDARWGLALHIGILTALLVQAALVTGPRAVPPGLRSRPASGCRAIC
jgi:hypothetical protein